MSNEKDAIRIDPAVQQFAEMLVSLFGPAAKVMAGQPAPDDNIVNMSMTRAAFEKQQADLAEVAQLRKQVESLQSQVDVAEKRLQASQKQVAEEQRKTAKAVDANRLCARQVASLQGQLRAAGSHATHAEYNKLWKQHTACKNQRDSYAVTIANKDKVIAELNTTIANLKKQPQTPCAVLIIDSIVYTPEEVRKIVAVSADRAREIERLTRDLTTMTSLRDNTIKDNERLTADNERLRSQVKVFYYNGKVISDERLKQLCDLGGAAEEAGFTKASFRSKSEHIVTQQTPGREPKAVFAHRRKVNDDGDEVVIYDPENVTIRIAIDPHRELTVAASLLPQMVQDTQANKNRADRLEGDLARCMERNNQQAAALRAANRRISDLQGTVQELNTRVTDKDADIQRLTIERNLIRGQLNELRALKTPARVNGQVLQAGEAYMTTALGMLPINSEGMRKLSDALDSYRAKVASLTKGLQEWIKT